MYIGVYKGCVKGLIVYEFTLTWADVKGLIVYEFTLTWADVMSPASTPARMVSGGVSEAWTRIPATPSTNHTPMAL